jgi:hypothetical protein
MALYTVRHSATFEGGVHKIGAELCGFVDAPESDPQDIPRAVRGNRA